MLAMFSTSLPWSPATRILKFMANKHETDRRTDRRTAVRDVRACGTGFGRATCQACRPAHRCYLANAVAQFRCGGRQI